MVILRWAIYIIGYHPHFQSFDQSSTIAVDQDGGSIVVHPRASDADYKTILPALSPYYDLDHIFLQCQVCLSFSFLITKLQLSFWRAMVNWATILDRQISFANSAPDN